MSSKPTGKRDVNLSKRHVSPSTEADLKTINRIGESMLVISSVPPLGREFDDTSQNPINVGSLNSPVLILGVCHDAITGQVPVRTFVVGILMCTCTEQLPKATQQNANSDYLQIQPKKSLVVFSFRFIIRILVCLKFLSPTPITFETVCLVFIF